jgi:putative CocE/NonD family hydrolase
MMKFIDFKFFVFILFLLPTAFYAHTTVYAGPSELTVESIEDSQFIKQLANKLLNNTDSGDAPIRHEIALQLVAENYDKASERIEVLTEQSRKMSPWIAALFTIHFRSFVDAKMIQTKHSQPFEKAFSASLLSAFKQVARRYSVYAIDSFGGNKQRQERELVKMINQFTDKPMNFKQAKSLVVQLNTWSMLKQTQQLATNILNTQMHKALTVKKSTIKMKDGAKLDVVVYLPVGAKGQLPSVLIYNLYAQGWSIDAKVKEAAMSGYAGVLVYSRGKGNSKDAIVPFEYEADDAYEIIDWISKQQWSDQKVAMYGGSYLGFTQWAATKKLHPALKTIVPSTAVVPGLNDNNTENGVLSTSSLPWFHLVGNNSTMDFGEYFDPRWQAVEQQWFNKGNAFNQLGDTAKNGNALFQRWLAHPQYDQYWQDMVPYKQDFANINIPILSTTGYFDHAQHGSTYFFKEHYKYNKQANHFLLIGPYDHLGAASLPRPAVNNYQIDPIAHISIDKVIYEWFDYVLKGQPKPSILKDKVNYQVMGTNQWHHSPTIEGMATDKLRFYLNVNNSLEAQRLQKIKPKKLLHRAQTVDFTDRTTINNSLLPGILQDSVAGPNGIEIISEPVEQSFIINGMFSGKFTVEINKLDMDFVAVLYELLPDGQYFKLSHFKGRSSYLNDSSKRNLLTPNKQQALVFSNTHLVSKKVKKGSRLVVVINVNKHSGNQVNYGSGKNVSEEIIADAGVPLTVKWFNDSYIEIPTHESFQ